MMNTGTTVPEKKAVAAGVTVRIAGRPGATVTLDTAGDNVIGRSTDASITIPDRLASRIHAAIRFHTVRHEWILRDVGSRNGTWLNGRRVDFAPLTAGAVIRIGTSELVFEELDAGSPPSPPSPPGPPPAAAPPAAHHVHDHQSVDFDEPVMAANATASRIAGAGTFVLGRSDAHLAGGSGEAAPPAPIHLESMLMRSPTLKFADWQRLLIVEALRRHRGNPADAARDLGIPPERLQEALARHGLVTHG